MNQIYKLTLSLLAVIIMAGANFNANAKWEKV